MNALPKLSSANPFGYRANSADQILVYLTRSVGNIPFASNEELYAAALIHKMRDQIQVLEHELKTVYRKYQAARGNTSYEQDTVRIKYCITHGVVLNNGYLYAGLDSELVIQDDYRAAIDRLIQS